jgi:hypothetical protein
MSILRASIEHIMDTATVLKVADQGESPERNKIENDKKENSPKGGFSVIFLPNAHIAQLVEHTTDTREVPGSIPGVRTSVGHLCEA